MWMAESLCCPLETITTLLLGYSPIQNKKLKKKKSYPALKKYKALGKHRSGLVIHQKFTTT